MNVFLVIRSHAMGCCVRCAMNDDQNTDQRDDCMGHLFPKIVSIPSPIRSPKDSDWSSGATTSAAENSSLDK